MLKKIQSGYTLIEIIVSMSILAVVGGILIYALYGAGRVARLDQAAQKIQTAIREANTLALSPSGTDPNIPKAYSVKLTKLGSESTSYEYTGTTSPLSENFKETVDFPPGVSIKEITETTSDDLYIIFATPFGKTFVTGDDYGDWTWTEVEGIWQVSSPNPLGGIITITLTLENDGGIEKNININSQTGETTIE